MSAAASSGNCGKGALSAGVSEYLGSQVLHGNELAQWGSGEMVAQTAKYGLIGGLVAKLTGANPIEGFSVAAAGYLFNDAAHAKPRAATQTTGFLDYLNATAAPELAEAEGVQNFVERYPKYAAAEGLVSLGVLFGWAIGAGLAAEASEVAGEYSLYDATGGLKGLNTNVNGGEFSANLQANGYTATQTTGTNGPVTVLQNGQGSTWTIYTRSSSITGDTGAQFIGPNGQFLKYNLGQQGLPLPGQ